jgi:hypothetical protein
MFVHHLNKDHTVFYIDVESGAASWLLPKSVNLAKDVRIITHLTDNNETYYEDTETNETHWTFPEGIMSTNAMNTLIKLRGMTTAQCEKIFKDRYNAEASTKLQSSLDAALEAEDDPEVEAVLSDTPQLTYVRHLNKENVGVFVCMQTGAASWLLPAMTNLTNVKILSHVSDDGELFYEDVASKKTLWKLPEGKLSVAVMNMMERLRGMNTIQCSRYLNQDFDPKASAALHEMLDSLMSDTENGSDEESETHLTKSSGSASVYLAEPEQTKKKASIFTPTWKYIRHLNKENAPIFVDMQLGTAMWLLPEGTDLKHSVRILCHATEESNELYYEDLALKQTEWSLPKDILSVAAANMLERLRGMTTLQCSRYVNQEFDAVASSKLQSKLESVVDLSSDEDEGTVSSVGSPPSRRMSRAVSSSMMSRVFGSLQEGDEAPVYESSVDELATGDDEGDEGVARTMSMWKASENKSLTVQELAGIFSKAGILNKLAKVSGRNWKSRYFWMTPLALVYFVDEKTSKKGIASKQGEMQITGDSSVEEEEKVEGQGFSFRVTTPWESMKLAAATVADRSSWIKAINAAIESNRQGFRGYQLKSGTMMSSKKFFILRSDLFTCHPDHSQPTKIENMVNLNGKTKITGVNETKFLFTVEDGDQKDSKYKFTIQFDKANSKDFSVWLKFLNDACAGLIAKSSTSRSLSTLMPSSPVERPSVTAGSPVGDADKSRRETKYSFMFGDKQNSAATKTEEDSAASAPAVEPTATAVDPGKSVKPQEEEVDAKVQTAAVQPQPQLGVFGLSAASQLDSSDEEDNSAKPAPSVATPKTKTETKEAPVPSNTENVEDDDVMLSFADVYAATEDIEEVDDTDYEATESVPIDQSSAKNYSVEDVDKQEIRTGSMNKLATISGRNWKTRFFVLNNFTLTYFVDEKTWKKGLGKQGEIMISNDTTVVEEENKDNQGHSFRVTTKWEAKVDSLLVAVKHKEDQRAWIRAIKHAIFANKFTLRGYQLRVGSLMSSKKFFVLRQEMITCHPDHTQISKIENLVNLNRNTKILNVNDTKFVLTVEDSEWSDAKYKLTIQFEKNGGDFDCWLRFLNNACAGTPISQESLTVVPRPSLSAPTAPRKTVTNMFSSSSKDDESSTSESAKQKRQTKYGAMFANVSAVTDETENTDDVAAPEASPGGGEAGVFGLDGANEDSDPDDEQERPEVDARTASGLRASLDSNSFVTWSSSAGSVLTAEAAEARVLRVSSDFSEILVIVSLFFIGRPDI